jgi:hypothetical protein
MKPFLLLALRAVLCIVLSNMAMDSVSAQTTSKKVASLSKKAASISKKSTVSKQKTIKPHHKKKKKAIQSKKKSSKKKTSSRRKRMSYPAVVQNIVKSNPVSWFLMTADLSWEKVLSRYISIQLAGTYTRQSGEIFDGLKANLAGYSITPEMRYYWMPFNKIVNPLKKRRLESMPIAAPLSFYTAVWGKMSDYKANVEFPDHPAEKAEIFHRRAYSGGVNFGSQFWIKFRKRPIFLCDFSLGGGWVEAKTETKLAENGKRIKLERKGFTPNLGFRIGLPLK